MTDIKNYDTFVKIEPVNKGLSPDKKYYIEKADGEKMLLRIADIEEYERKKGEYNMMECVYKLGVLTPRPVDFGLCNGGKNIYYLSGWLDGEDAETAVLNMSETEQYILGVKAGEMLAKIHGLPAPENAEPWGDKIFRKVQDRINFYNNNPIKSKNGDIIVCYLQENKNLLYNRTQTFNHGDFNIENIMIMPNGQVGVIDFNYYLKGYGDPYWEFCSIPWGTEPSSYFYTGLIKGYFNGEPPNKFFNMISYYLAYDALAAVCDTSAGNQGEPEDGIRHMENIMRWFNNLKNIVPSWYIK